MKSESDTEKEVVVARNEHWPSMLLWSRKHEVWRNICWVHYEYFHQKQTWQENKQTNVSVKKEEELVNGGDSCYSDILFNVAATDACRI